MHPALREYMVELVQATRDRQGEEKMADLWAGAAGGGISPRGTLALFCCARAYALVQGRGFVVPEDITALAVPVLAHRLGAGRLSGRRLSAPEMIHRLLNTLPLPTEDWGRAR
mgnify:FL=1